MTTAIEVQIAEMPEADARDLPEVGQIRDWALAALEGYTGPSGICIRIVGRGEGELLNSQFRDKAAATNVLAFPAYHEFEPESDILGDIAICAPVVCKEAQEEDMPLRHWAHMVVHGVLHLLGHDHQTQEEASLMQSFETSILTRLGFDTPWASR